MGIFSTQVIIGTSFFFMLVVLGVLSQNNTTVSTYICTTCTFPYNFIGILSSAYTSITGLVLVASALAIGLFNFPNPFLIFGGVLTALLPLALGILNTLSTILNPIISIFIIGFILTIDGILVIEGLVDWWGQKTVL